MKTVVIFGAGVAGLSTAHEFLRLGYAVTVYEANDEAGGFFRSARMPEDHGMPSEYSWHGFGPWYHNTFDVMKQIPFDAQGSVYDKGFSRPINYGIVADKVQGDEESAFSMFERFRMNAWDKVRWAKLLFKTWSANHRTEKDYALRNASEAWKPIMSDFGWKTWRATFGPWVGSDWTRASLHHVGQFFRRNLMSGPRHHHRADEQGSAWTQGPNAGWLLLAGPSNEAWFDKWTSYLQSKGARFFYEKALKRLNVNGDTITSAVLEDGEEVHADLYVLATNPFAAAEILDRTPELAKLDQLRLFRPLIADGPHTQVSFRIAFAEKIAWPKERSALLLPDSEFNLTLFAEEQVWKPEVSLGEGIASLWTATACVATAPGSVYGVPMFNCTKEQFIEEVKTQLLRCEGLDRLLKKANNGKGMKDFPIVRIEVWHEWQFSPSGIAPKQPKWVMSDHTQPYLPTQKTPVANLLLAGAHTKTEADIWSIEAAVESGRRAARVIDPNVKILPQFKPLWLRILSFLDDLCFRLHLPHIVDLILLFLVVLFVVVILN